MAEPTTEPERTTLTPFCGHHCGTVPAGEHGRMTRHCPCDECHGQLPTLADLIEARLARRGA